MSDAVVPPTDITIGAIADGVAVVTLARPAARNALRHQTMIELADALSRLDDDEHVRCIVLTGGERVFAAGADIAEMVLLDGDALRDHPRTHAWQRIWRSLAPCCRRLQKLRTMSRTCAPNCRR